MRIQGTVSVRVRDLDHVAVAHHPVSVLCAIPNLHVRHRAFFGCHHSRALRSRYVPSSVLLAVFLCDLVPIGNREQIEAAGLVVR